MSYAKEIGDVVDYLEKNPEILPKKETFVIPFFNKEIKNKVFPRNTLNILKIVTKKNPWTVKRLANKLRTGERNIEKDISILEKFKLIRIKNSVVTRNKNIFVFPLDN